MRVALHANVSARGLYLSLNNAIARPGVQRSDGVLCLLSRLLRVFLITPFSS